MEKLNFKLRKEDVIYQDDNYCILRNDLETSGDLDAGYFLASLGLSLLANENDLFLSMVKGRNNKKKIIERLQRQLNMIKVNNDLI